MTPEMRANIVAKLRAAADKIEAGGEPLLYCYHHGFDFEETLATSYPDTVEEARGLIPVDLSDDYWDDGVECQDWGVRVVVEAVERLAHRHADRHREGFDEWVRYGLVDPDTYTGPEVEPHECRDCGAEVRRAPGEPCPGCSQEAP